MSDDLHNRVGGLEQRQAQTEQWQAETKQRLGHIETAVEKTSKGMDKLLEHNAKRPEPASWRTVFATVVSVILGCGVIGGFVWWLVATAPAVQELSRRVTELDHPRIGRVPTLERRIDTLGGWQPRTVPAAR